MSFCDAVSLIMLRSWVQGGEKSQVSSLGSSEASAPQRFKCISIMGDSNGGRATVRSRGGAPSREGPFSEVPLYLQTKILVPHNLPS